MKPNELEQLNRISKSVYDDFMRANPPNLTMAGSNPEDNSEHYQAAR